MYSTPQLLFSLPPPPYSYAFGSFRLCSHLSMFSGTDTYSENLSSAMDTTSLLALAAAGAATVIVKKDEQKRGSREGGWIMLGEKEEGLQQQETLKHFYTILSRFK